jgi:tetraacyldisaccharide 4'-kinase
MRWIERQWQERTFSSSLLLPLSVLYCGFAAFNRQLYERGWRRAIKLPVPVIVVGNITVGGTGKTPLVLWVVRHLKERGWRPGIVTRGYRGRARTWPQIVTADSDPDLVGDEPVLLARRADVLVVADPDRPRAVERLIAGGCDIAVSDDGLQHYRLQRDIEVAVVDGERRFGNGRCLPAGPLRERPSRLEEVDACVVHGKAGAGEWSMALVPVSFRRVGDSRVGAPLDAFSGRTVHAVAGIGRPARFFVSLRALGVRVIEHPFADHHRFRAPDVRFPDGYDVIMTEKDAVKCEPFTTEHLWYLAVDAHMSAGFGEWLQARLGKKSDG